MLRKPYPRDADSISREVSATLKVKDITQYYRLRDRLQFKWWEFFVMALLFVAGLGFVVTMLYLLPSHNLQLYLRFLAFWTVILVFAVIASLEILIAKVKALYLLLYYQAHLLQDLQREIRRHGGKGAVSTAPGQSESPQETD